MAIAMELPGLRPDIERATEIVPPCWIDDDDIIRLEARYGLLLFERFADGTLLVTPPAGWTSSSGNAHLTYQVVRWALSGGHGKVLDSSGGVRLPDGSLFAPDATYLSRERWEAADRAQTFAHAVPDAAFEILSTSDRVRSTMKKIDAYLRNGVRLVVLIDPMRLEVYVGREGDEAPRDLGNVDELDCSPVMPGFVLDIAAIRNAG